MPHIRNSLAGRAFLVIALFYSIVISILFFLPTTEIPDINFSAADKLLHGFIYFVLSILWMAYFYSKNGNRIGLNWVLVLFFSILLYGIIVEIFQGLFTASREADIFDLIANVIGTVFGIFFFKKIRHFINA